MSDKKLFDNLSLNSTGCTLWLTGLSGSGKTTIGSRLNEIFKLNNIGSICLDGDVLRCGINKNLGFSNEDRDENVRRISEVSKLFSMNNMISIPCCISPYKSARSMAREIHENAGTKFFEIFINSPLSVCESRDVKGLYKKARAGEIKKFTGIDDVYEEPCAPDLNIRTNEHTVDECITEIIDFLIKKEIIIESGAAKFSLNSPQAIHELFVTDEEEITRLREQCESLERCDLSKIDMQWLQVLAEGWASPLTGFMRERDYLQSLHFSGILRAGQFISMSLPIVLSVDAGVKESNSKELALYFNGELVAKMENIEFFPHRKEERICRTFGCNNNGHPTIEIIEQSSDWLVGGDVKVIKKRFLWNDGLDNYRLTPREIRSKMSLLNADGVFAFQLRNPIHNGHALLMKETRRRLIEEFEHKNPVLLLHPLGGWVKDDDVPLDIRIRQHEACIDEQVLDRDSTLLAIFPSPMVYAGPREVQWHARTRVIAGSSYYIVGRDPAGIKHPSNPDLDLYEPTHGKKVLCDTPGLDGLKVLPFSVAAFNKKSSTMEFYDESKKEDFLFISGSKMRSFARNGEEPPFGFMAPKAWSIIATYYAGLKEN